LHHLIDHRKVDFDPYLSGLIFFLHLCNRLKGTKLKRNTKQNISLAAAKKQPFKASRIILIFFLAYDLNPVLNKNENKLLNFLLHFECTFYYQSPSSKKKQDIIIIPSLKPVGLS